MPFCGANPIPIIIVGSPVPSAVTIKSDVPLAGMKGKAGNGDPWVMLARTGPTRLSRAGGLPDPGDRCM